MDDEERRALRRSLSYIPAGGLWSYLLRSNGPQLSWEEQVRLREKKRRLAEAGVENPVLPEKPTEQELELWYGKKLRHLASPPIDWSEEVDQPPEPDLG